MKSDGKKLEQARELLAQLGMPKAQQNSNAVYTFLAFASVGPGTSWARATAPRLTPHEVIAFAAKAIRQEVRREHA